MKEPTIALFLSSLVCFTMVLLGIEGLDTKQDQLQAEIQALAEKEQPASIVMLVTQGNEYSLSDKERDFVERVVMAEAGGEDLIGQVLVAQCILNSCLQDDIRPIEVCIRKDYTEPAESASESVREAVNLVFDGGYKYTEENIQYFYAPAKCKSEWHESQEFVLEYGSHRFFK